MPLRDRRVPRPRGWPRSPATARRRRAPKGACRRNHRAGLGARHIAHHGDPVLRRKFFDLLVFPHASRLPGDPPFVVGNGFEQLVQALAHACARTDRRRSLEQEPLGAQRVGELQAAAEVERARFELPHAARQHDAECERRWHALSPVGQARAARQVGRVCTHLEQVETRRVAGDVTLEIVSTDE